MRNELFVCRPLSDARLASPARHVLQPSLRAFVSPSQEPASPMTRLRPAVLLVAAAVARACWSARAAAAAPTSEASSSTDVNELLTQTFTGSKQVESGNLDLSLKIEAQGGESQLDGPVDRPPDGPVPGPGRRQAAEVQARRRVRGRRPEHQGGRDVDRREGLRLLPGHRLRRRGPGLPAVQGRLRAGPEAGLRRTSRASPRSGWTRASG